MRHYGLIEVFAAVFLSCSLCLFGQQTPTIDNLELELKNQQSDTGKIRILLAMADKFSTSDTSKAMSFIEKAWKIAKPVNNLKVNADILLNEGNIFFTLSDFSKALVKLEKALLIYKQLNLKSDIAKCSLKIGGIYATSAKYTRALSCYSEAMKIYSLINEKLGMSRCYQLMSLVYFDQRNFKFAIDCTQRAIMLVNKNNKHRVAKLYLNLFLFYVNATEYNKALPLMDSIFPTLKEVKDFESLEKAYNNLSILYIELKDYKKAKEAILNVIYYDSKLGNLYNRIYANINLALVYSNTGKLDSAIILLKKALDLNKQLKNNRVYGAAYHDIYAAYEKQGNTKMALEYYKKFVSLNDSLTADLNNQKLLEIQSKYELDLKNEQIKILIKNEQLAKQKIVILGIGFLLILISSLFLWSYRHRKAKEKQLLFDAEIQNAAYKHKLEIQEVAHQHEVELKEAAYKIGVKHRELTYKAIHISQQEQILMTIKDKLEGLDIESSRVKETVVGLVSGINQQLKQNAFEDFEKYFIEVHPRFYNSLKQKFPDLSQNELKVCALIRLNLNNKQIAEITGKSSRSVENTRYFIRKKMDLTVEDNLFQELSKV